MLKYFYKSQNHKIMKNILFVLMMISVFACTKSEMLEQKQNEMSLNGVLYPIKTAYLEQNTWSGGTCQYLHLSDVDISESQMNTFLDGDLSNIQLMDGSTSVMFMLRGNELIDLDALESTTINDVSVFVTVEFNVENLTFKQAYRFTSTTLTLLKSQTYFELKFECTNNDGVALEGYYLGDLFIVQTVD